jgi:hypothetical protein
VIERLEKFLAEHLELPVYVRRKYGLFAWRRPMALSEDGWAKHRLYFFNIHHYNTFTYRISISASDSTCLPKKITDRGLADASDRVELSFVSADLDQVISPDLPKFVESVFDTGLEGAHPWPLFASDWNFPAYAWSIAGEAARLSQLGHDEFVEDPLGLHLLAAHLVDEYARYCDEMKRIPWGDDPRPTIMTDPGH